MGFKSPLLDIDYGSVAEWINGNRLEIWQSVEILVRGFESHRFLNETAHCYMYGDHTTCRHTSKEEMVTRVDEILIRSHT